MSTDAAALVPGIPGLSFALQMNIDSISLDKRIKHATATAEASDTFGTVGSLSVGLKLISLEPKISSVLQSIASKNETFAGLGIVVLYSLVQLKNDTDAFGKAIVTKLDTLEAGLAPVIMSSIDSAFDSAISAFQSQAI
ncbi:cell wall mannoprotein 1 family protein [Aspergillus tanneri]|uniref:Uncharacterized protein n=1 Tax=Aspergillus tanneri TaxID=1220188 RepID=A0A5M9MG90_9EURO|nr:uncharacterized protein ATNIH1004_008179 [Aspergillus tanneri]KAA8643983.1 hypothetical protein ATNIH1004_008179 [Aspergillus tanneri]